MPRKNHLITVAGSSQCKAEANVLTAVPMNSPEGIYLQMSGVCVEHSVEIAVWKLLRLLEEYEARKKEESRIVTL